MNVLQTMEDAQDLATTLPAATIADVPQDVH